MCVLRADGGALECARRGLSDALARSLGDVVAARFGAWDADGSGAVSKLLEASRSSSAVSKPEFRRAVAALGVAASAAACDAFVDEHGRGGQLRCADVAATVAVSITAITSRASPTSACTSTDADPGRAAGHAAALTVCL